MITTRKIITKVNRGLICQTGEIPDRLRFIQDTYPLEIMETKSMMSESKGMEGRPVLKITGVFQKWGERNQNGREYPQEVITAAVTAIQEDISKRAVMGEFDHPQDAKIHLDRVSHVITKLWMEGKYVYGVAEVLEDMPCGKMLATLLRNKVQVGISSRGVGDMEMVNESSGQYYRVQPGYQFVTWDIVGEPSVSEAVMHVMESRNRIPTRAARPADKALLAELSKWLSGRAF